MDRQHVMQHELRVRLPAPEFAKGVHDEPMPGHRRGNADSKRAGLAQSNPFGPSLRLIDFVQNPSRIA